MWLLGLRGKAHAMCDCSGTRGHIYTRAIVLQTQLAAAAAHCSSDLCKAFMHCTSMVQEREPHNSPFAESQVKYKIRVLNHFKKERVNLERNLIAPGCTCRWTQCTVTLPTGGKVHKQPHLKCLNEAKEMCTQKLKIALHILRAETFTIKQTGMIPAGLLQNWQLLQLLQSNAHQKERQTARFFSITPFVTALTHTSEIVSMVALPLHLLPQVM